MYMYFLLTKGSVSEHGEAGSFQESARAAEYWGRIQGVGETPDDEDELSFNISLRTLSICHTWTLIHVCWCGEKIKGTL